MIPGTMSLEKSRQSRSLYTRREIPGQKIVERKSLFKAPQNVSRSNLNRSRGIPVPTKNGLNNSRSSQVFTGRSTKHNKTSSKFLRPQIDMLAARKRMLERALRLGETSGNNVELKSSDTKNSNIMQKINLGCTPKQSALTKVYLKLSESAKKATNSAKLVPTIPKSSRDQEVLHGKSKLNSTSVVNNSCSFKNESQSSKPLILCSSRVGMSEDNKEINNTIMITPNSKEGLVFMPDFSDRGNGEDIGNKNTGNCALRNILKHCQLYYSKISSVTSAVACLDDSFQRVIAGEIGGHVYSKFCEYQRKKLELYREIKVIEGELDDAVRKETDIQAKFQEYLKKKVDIWKEESNLLEGFKSTVNEIINKYEEEVVKPPETNNLNELVQMLTSSMLPKKEMNDKPVLRRSKRLILTPKPTATRTKSSRVLRSNSGENVKQSDELVIKRNTKSSDRRCIQRSIYKDLQKSFNLLSPECSF